jgi:hypothetical protein
MRAITFSAAQLSMAVADTCAQQVRIRLRLGLGHDRVDRRGAGRIRRTRDKTQTGRFEHLAFHPVVGPGAIGEQNCGHRCSWTQRRCCAPSPDTSAVTTSPSWRNRPWCEPNPAGEPVQSTSAGRTRVCRDR